MKRLWAVLFCCAAFCLRAGSLLSAQELFDLTLLKRLNYL
jgi:hypothetical protein